MRQVLAPCTTTANTLGSVSESLPPSSQLQTTLNKSSVIMLARIWGSKMYFKIAVVKATWAAKVLWKLIDPTRNYKWRKFVIKVDEKK